MGGNALSVYTRRYSADEYYELEKEVLGILRRHFPDRRVETLPAYRQKESFGDMDVLFESDNLRTNLREFISDKFGSKEIKKNGSCYSFEYKEFQIDLINMPAHNFQTALNYYSWNDLGNFLGRIAYRMGFKYGHEGLVLVFREGNYKFAEEVVSKDTAKILEFMGYDPEVFAAGFDTLEEIYRFVASTPYFNKEIFSYENRNHIARVRDRKRANYRGFMEWIQQQEKLPAYNWPKMSEHGGRVLLPEFKERAFKFFPDFKAVYDQIMEDFEIWKTAKTIFNGGMVSDLTGLTGKELGGFMTFLRHNPPADDFRRWVVDNGQEKVTQWIKQMYVQYKLSVF